MAKLYFRYGAMGASKTANALMVKFNYEERGQDVLLLKPRTDTRNGTKVHSRIGLEAEAAIIGPGTDIFAVVSVMIKGDRPLSCVIVDEAQFLEPEQVDSLTEIVDKLGIPVICYGLRADFQGKLFPGSEALLALADSIEEIKTICWCGQKAIMNMRIQDGKAIYTGEQIRIGGSRDYAAVCRKHWKEGKYNR